MSPEKVALLVVSGLIAVLLAVALLGTEPASAAPEDAGRALILPAPRSIEQYSFEQVRDGLGRTRVEPKVTSTENLAPARTRPQTRTVAYTIKKNDTIERIARRELGSPSYVGKILALNKGVDPAKLKIGSKLTLPAPPASKPDTTAEAVRGKGSKGRDAASGKTL